ncbi:MAG: hypothetical protein U0L55_02415 [Acutalibacteraceae bacterium]|nr:hypothetical protein [Acutalibacteraceae bacterium]
MKSKLSKALVLLLSLAMIAVQLTVPAFAAEACKHDSKKYGTPVAETCTDYGYTPWTCNAPGCGYKGVDMGNPPTGHSKTLEDVPAKAADCTNVGWNAYKKCGNPGCDYKEGYQEIAALGHNYVDKPGLEPTCIATGYTAYKECTRCKDTVGKTILAVANHHYTVSVEEGKYCPDVSKIKYTCVLCDDFYERDVTGSSYDHTYVTVPAKAPTCTEKGNVEYKKCAVCKWTESGSKEIPALGHKGEVTKQAVDPTCIKDGNTIEITCTVCKAVVVASEVLPKSEKYHDLETIAAKDPSCTAPGNNEYKKCKICGYEEGKVVTAQLPHTELAGSRGKVLPTCTEKGYTTALCTTCNKEFKVEGSEVPAKGHKMTEQPALLATCTTKGHTAYTECSVCGHQEGKVELPALGHDMKSETKPATCTAKGYEKKYCSRCNACTTEKELEKIPHTYVAFAENKVATFNEPVHAAGKKCSVCGHIEGGAITDPRLNESVQFSYEVKGSDKNSTKFDKDAVNSGYVTVKVKMTVKSEIARFYGATVALNFSNNLKLVNVSVPDATLFAKFEATPYADTKDAAGNTVVGKANAQHKVFITQDMDSQAFYKTFTSEKDKNGNYATTYEFAVLTFKVNNDAADTQGVVEFDQNKCEIARREADPEQIADPTYTTGIANELDRAFVDSAAIDIVKLGDGAVTGTLTVSDTLALNQWFNTADENAYKIIYDMDKDGDVDSDDFILLRKATVGNEEYLKF